MNDHKNHPFLEQLDEMPEEVKQKLMDEYINPISEKMSEQVSTSSLESPQMAKEKAKLQMLDNLQSYQTTMVRASEILKNYNEFPQIDIQKLQQVMSEDDSLSTLPDFENPEEFVSKLKDKKSLKEKLNIKSEDLDKIYNRTDNLLKENNIADAECVAQFLLMFDGKNSMYWIAYGITLLQQDKIQDAKQAFSMSVVLNNQNAWAFYYLADTLVRDNEKEQAREILSELIPELAKIEELKELHEMAKDLQVKAQDFKKI